MLYPIILSGGIGTRLWPVSSQKNPKQFQKFFNDQTLLQNTYRRILSGFDKKNVFVVGKLEARDYIKSQIDIASGNIITEPQTKGTAMAIGLAALKISQLSPQTNVVIVNSDHFIKDEKKYIKLLKDSEKILDEKYPDKFILAGIKPTYPETGYGYIKVGKKLGNDLFLVDSFKEKPDYSTAEQYIKEGFLWNPAIFLFKAKNLLAWYDQYLPETFRALTAISKDWSPANLTNQYSKVDNISIDYGLLEKMSDMLLIKTDIDWADIGSWRSLRDILSDNKKTNISNVKNVTIDSHNNLFYASSGKLIATIGVEDMVLVETEDVIFLCPAERAQDVKNLLVDIKKQNLDKYL
ncbi:MAG: hypothetical protein A2406_04070 [Candidatus Komeilibacteria bacterium RIFOXYC1_FULL_37_11]|uniref:Uncharacterized protein n=1 Tax=Candidatus Komeilibacteria bacterium RIFOXYC1_FULL_37_11 TaxID=1798555 RepID=A0A1G2BWZ8_9BACT|nr:MAG: hypothetical protein A2406_04070 [Candidatus Komeilibacteria bacterium RIFOXYC1_FULL_37_11]OGY95842.1 MAG: hypothetical protein A2611_03650 [Candidatus Komeilibacteria bacterium RIFOXYD1_FULL_37_29]